MASQATNGSEMKTKPEDQVVEEQEISDEEELSSGESEEEDIEEDDLPVQTIASTRPKRANAGAKMASLINNPAAAENDEFYQKAYGGFTEEAEDADFDKEANNEEENDEEIEDETEEPVVSQEATEATNA